MLNQFDYNTSVPQGGFGADVPNQIQAMRYSQPKSVLSTMFNAPAYQKQRATPQQMGGMNRHLNDQYRATAWRNAGNMDRSYFPANQQLQMQQLGAASQSMNALNDIMTQGMLGDRQNQMNQMQANLQMFPGQMQFLQPFMGMFGG